MAKKPVEYSQEIADEICQAIRTSSKGIRKIALDYPHWPSVKAIFEWRVKHPSFGEQYARAKCEQIEVFIDEIIEISDDSSSDTIIKTDANGIEYEKCNSEWINRSRLRVDSRKWLAAKLAPKIYGERKESDDKDGTDFISKNRDKLNNK